MSALPHVTVTIPSGAIEYQTLDRIAGRGERLVGAEQARNSRIAERETCGGGSDEERAAAQIRRLALGNFTYVFMLPSARFRRSRRYAFQRPRA